MDKEKLKNDKELLKELKEKEQQAFKEEDIVGLYDILDSYLYLDLEDEKIDTIYQKILQIAFDALADMITENRLFDFEKERDFYIARGIYEHALERWERGDYKAASELFALLSYMVPKEFQEAMYLPLALTLHNQPIDRFIEEFIDKEALDEESIFFDRFKPEAKEFVAKYAQEIESALKGLFKQ